MKKHLLRRAALALSISLISSGCGSLEARLKDAAADKGKASAGVILPDLPPECYVDQPHAPLILGAEARTTLRRERQATTDANDSKRRCVGVYGDFQRGFAAP